MATSAVPGANDTPIGGCATDVSKHVDFPIELIEPNDETEAFMERNFEAYYTEKVGEGMGWVPFTLTVTVGEEIIAAVNADVFWGGVVINRLVVEKPYRKHGLGSWLLKAGLQVGYEAGARIASLETFDYQAPDFYPKHGFKIDLERKGFAKDLTFVYLHKILAEEDAAAQPMERELPGVGLATLNRVSMDDRLEEFFAHVFNSYSVEKLGADARFSRFAFVVYDNAESRKLIAILEGKMFWGGLFLSEFIVEKEYRGRGIGETLLEKALQLGASKGCSIVCVESFDFQSPGFYKKHGFTEDLVRSGWKNGRKFHYLSKPLAGHW